MRNLTLTALLAASLLYAGGCARDDAKAPSAGTQPATASSPIASSGAPPSATPAAPPSAAPAAPANTSSGLRGTVVERLDVPSYTYLRIKTAKGEIWAAIPSNSVAVGTEVALIDGMPMKNFPSNALKRTFDVIYFSSGIEEGGASASPAAGLAAPSAPESGKPVANPHVGNGATEVGEKTDVGNVKVAKAEGSDARTVAEVFEQSKSLKGKNVTVRAKVVKVTSGVLDRNWLHLRDGSGTAEGKNNDLVVTTTSDAKVGDEVTVSGVVETDKDLGAGYVYSVLVENAKVIP